ncbi:MAG: mitochondrial fission ELM1 family protein [Pseudomonadales bacterium]|nr:mitochondrial fission ELM1 family protein [Pseudomonadales bacterium]
MPSIPGADHTQQTLRVLVVSDGKPGHENQSIGLTRALSKYRKVELVQVEPLSHRSALKAIILKSVPDAWSELQPDIVIGTGSGTQFTLIACKQIYKCFTVVLCGPSFPSACFDLCVIPKHDNRPEKTNIVFTDGVINKVTPSKSSEPSRGLVLIGGESKHYRWDSDAIDKQIREIAALHPNITWNITNSRRTPDDLNRKLEQLPEHCEFHHWQSTDKEWLPREISLAGQIWVTPDSVSMVYESLTSGNAVYLFDLSSTDTRVAKGIEALRHHKTGALKDGQITPPLAPTPLWEADRIAQALLERTAKI